MNKKNLSVKTLRNESGVALLLALAVLAILLIMLIGFLSSSLLERKALNNQTAHVGSKIAARSALRKVAATLKYYGADVNASMIYSDDSDPHGITPFASHGPTGTGTVNADNTDGKQAYKLLKEAFFADNDGKGGYFSEDAWFSSADAARKAEWLPLQAGTDGRLTGRVAYLIFPNLGINPLHFTTADQAPDTGDNLKPEIYYWAKDENNNETLHKNTRLSHLAFLNSESGTVLTDSTIPNWISTDFMTAYFDTYGPSGSTNSINTKKTGYTDFRNNSSAATARDFFNLYFMPYTACYAINDAENQSGTGNAATATGPIRGGERTDDRFNLYQFSWWENRTTVNPSDFSKLTHITKFSSPQKEQILANLIDYNDTDSIPTSDVAAETWKSSITHPSYTGNEKTPYLAQFAMQYDSDAKVSYICNGPDSNGQYTYDILFSFNLNLTPSAKLVNLYDVPLSGPWEILIRSFNFHVSGTVKLIMEGGNLQKKEFQIFPAAAGLRLKDAAAEIPAHGNLSFATPVNYNNDDPYNHGESYQYKTTFQFGPTSSDTLPPDMSIEFNATLKEEQLPYAPQALILSQNGSFVDYAYPSSGRFLPSDQPLYQDQTLSVPNEDSCSNSYPLSWEAVDPRCNLVMDGSDSTDGTYWKLNPSDLAFKSPKNTDFSTTKDVETAEDVKDVSTGKFFRNGPMRSAAELGLIHRGEPFQTLNMRVYNTETDSTTYEDGDGILWDQVKPTRLGYDHVAHIYDEPAAAIDAPVGENKESGLLYDEDTKMVRFNVNTPGIHEQAFRLLTGNLRYRDANGAYQKLPDDACESLAKWIACRCYEAKDGDPAAADSKCYSSYSSWGELAGVFNDWAKNKEQSKAPDLTDYALEELIGATMTLTRIGEPYEYYTVLIVAQTIKDVGGDGDGITIYRYKADGTPVDAAGKECKLGTYEKDYDEILDTSYLVARVRRTVEHKLDDACKAGTHTDCPVKVEVLESYLVPR